MRAAAGHASCLPGAGEPILATQHAIDLLRLEAGELFWRGPGAVQAQRCDLVGLGLRRIKAAIGALGVEHGEHAGDAIARQAEFMRLRVIIVVVVVVRRHADCQNLAHRRIGELIVQPGGDPFRLRHLGDRPAGQLDQPAADGDGVLRRQGGSPADERHVDRHAAPIDVLERPILLPFRARQRPRPAIDLAHRLDILARVGEKALPFLGMLAGRGAFDAKQLDKFLAVGLLAGAAQRARGAFKIGRQVGDAGLDHRIDDAFRRQERKSERREIPDRGVEARVPRGKDGAALEGGAQIRRRVIPIEDRAVGVPALRGAPPTANAHTIASRRRGIGIGSGRLEIETPAEGTRNRNRRVASEPEHRRVSRRAGDAAARWAAATPASGAGAGPSNDIQSATVSTGTQVLPYCWMRVGGAFELHDRRDFAIVLPAETVAHRLDQPDDFSLAAFGVGLEHDLRAGIDAGDALQVDRHLLLPREALVGQLRDVGQRLADRHQLFAEYLVAVTPTDPPPHEGGGVDRPQAVGLGDGSPLPERPDATLSALELHERVYWTAADGRGVDRLERRRQRRQRSGSERARFRSGGDCPAVIVGGVGVGIVDRG